MNRTKEPQTWLERLERLHPYEMMLYLGMFGSGLIFFISGDCIYFIGAESIGGLESPDSGGVSHFHFYADYIGIYCDQDEAALSGGKYTQTRKCTQEHVYAGCDFYHSSVCRLERTHRYGNQFHRASKWQLSLFAFRHSCFPPVGSDDFCDYTFASAGQNAGRWHPKAYLGDQSL